MSAVFDATSTLVSEALPKGWRTVTFEDIVADDGLFVDGDWVESKDQDPEGDVRLIQLADVGDGEYRDRSKRFLTSVKAAELGCTLLEAGDLLIARMPDPLGRACIFPGDRKRAVTVVDVAVLRPRNDALSTRWLMYCINAPQFRRVVASLQSGSTRQRISRRNLAKIVFPLPPRGWQDEVVTEIEKQFSRLDDAVAGLERARTNLKRYKAAVLADALEGELAGPREGWARSVLGNVALSVRNGVSEKPDAETGTRVLRISAVRPLELAENDVRYLRGPLETYESFRLASGDVLFTRYNGNPELVGACAVVPQLAHPTVYPDKLIRVRVPPDVVSPAFLALTASTGQGRAFLKSRIRTTAGQAGISGADIKQLPIRLPSLAEQHRIVAEVDRRLSIVREGEAEVVTNLKRAQALRQAILSKAFAGSGERGE